MTDLATRDPARALRLAITGRWLEHLFDVEARAAMDFRRNEELHNNGSVESARLERLARAWHARTLVLLQIDAGGRGDQHLDLVQKALWERDVT